MTAWPGRLEGRVAVVTGAATGLGRAISRRFAEQGAHVVLTDLVDRAPGGAEGGETTLELITGAGGSGQFLAADVADEQEVDALIAAAASVTGRVDVVVNNAGHFGGASILETSEADWQEYLRTNLTTQFQMSKRAIAQMIGQQPIGEVRGRLINMSSQLGLAAPPAAVAYASAKAASAQLTRQLAVDYARHGIIVNALAPGRIITGMHPGEAEYLADGTVDDATAYSLTRTPFPRLGRPDDVAGAALFLASDDCTFVSGHVLAVDGGWLAS